MIRCTATDCEAEGSLRCDSCGKARCAEHIELDVTGEWFCDFACGGSGKGCTRCRTRRANVDGVCWGCRRDLRMEATR